MIKYLITLSLMVFSSAALAAHVVSDPLGNQSTTHCGFVMDSGTKQDIAVVRNASNQAYCSLDISTLAAGTHTVTVTAIINDPVFGRRESAASAPLNFTVPALPTVPGNIRLAL